MSRSTVVSLVDDLDGSPADETLSFAVDGKAYEIELSATHAADLRSGLNPFIERARPAGRPRRGMARSANQSTPTSRRAEQAAVRKWARSQGMSVSDRGRIPRGVWDAYEKRDLSRAQTVPSPFMS